MKKFLLGLMIVASLIMLVACKDSNTEIKNNGIEQVNDMEQAKEKIMYEYDVSFLDEQREFWTDEDTIFATLKGNDLLIHCDENEEAAEKMMDYLRDKSNRAYSEVETKADSFRNEEQRPSEITFEVMLELLSIDEDKIVFTLTEKSSIDGETSKKVNEYYFDSQTGDPIESLNKE